MQPAVIPFQIAIDGRGAAGYLLRATAAGRDAEAALELPALPTDPAELGLALGRALFPPPLRRLLLDIAHGADESGARIQLQLRVAPPELAGLPWEWASLGGAAPWQPAVRDDYALVRVGRQARPIPPLTVAGPLRLLIVCAPGAQKAAAHLGHAIAGPVTAGLLEADLLLDATPDDLAAALAEEPCHLLHLVAAAEPAPRGQGPGRGLGPADLAEILDESPGLRLVTLAPADPAAGGMAGLAAALHADSGIAALALDGLTAPQAAIFGGALYASLAAGDPADLAATDGRAALAGAGAPWGLPQIHLAPGGERLFHFSQSQIVGAQRAEPPQAHASPQYERGAPHPRSARESARVEARRAAPARRTAPDPRPRPMPAILRRPLAMFAVQSTRVGAPARRAPADGGPRPAISPKLAILLVALLILAFMVSRVLRLPGAEAAPPAPAGAAAPMRIPVPTLLPTIQAGVGAAVANVGAGGPLSAPEPRSYATYLVSEGDTLEQIARRAGSDPAAIAAYNFLNPLDPPRPGRPLVLPIYQEGEALPPAPIINRGSPARPQVALTFDIELDDLSLYAILDTLRARQLRATFFVTGSWVKQYPAAAQAIVRDGHELANHSLTHPAFSTIGYDGAAAELEQTERIVREVTGASTRPYFRFPYGDSTPAMVETVARQGYVAYHWSADDKAIPSWLARAAANPAQAYGGILLMHGRQSTADALPAWLDQLQAIGLEPTTLGAVLR